MDEVAAQLCQIRELPLINKLFFISKLHKETLELNGTYFRTLFPAVSRGLSWSYDFKLRMHIF